VDYDALGEGKEYSIDQLGYGKLWITGEKSRQMIGQDKERMEFISATTHELKTSLTAIIASAELLADELQLQEKSVPGKLIQSIIRNAHSIDDKLSHFPEMARLVAGDFQLQPEPVKI